MDDGIDIDDLLDHLRCMREGAAESGQDLYAEALEEARLGIMKLQAEIVALKADTSWLTSPSGEVGD